MLGSVAEHGTGGVSDGANGESGRRASVPESKRSMTDTEQRGDSNYEETDFSEAENSLFNMAMPSFISSLNFNKLGGGRNHHSNHSHHHQSSNNVDNFKRFLLLLSFNDLKFSISNAAFNFRTSKSWETITLFQLSISFSIELKCDIYFSSRLYITNLDIFWYFFGRIYLLRNI